MDDNDIKILVRINPDNSFVASIFSENLAVMTMDLGRICREHFNGGGHPGAAGFSYDIESFFSHVNEIVRVKEGYPEGSKINYNDDVAKISDALAALVFYELRKEINK
jgi:oligoribonuclease NrnB/cAMP/cGMP phosphodiesterase (DHH superfamily)